MFTRIGRFLTSRTFLWILLWILHVVLVAGIVVALYLINRHYHLETELLSPFPQLHPYWLPLLFLLVYIGAWLGWWFFTLLTDPHDSRYPDITSAWSAGMRALAAAGIDPAEAPLYLVIGKPRSGTVDFFASTKLSFAVRAEPRARRAGPGLRDPRGGVCRMRRRIGPGRAGRQVCRTEDACGRDYRGWTSRSPRQSRTTGRRDRGGTGTARGIDGCA